MLHSQLVTSKWILSLLALCAASCSGSSSSTPPAGTSVTGTWLASFEDGAGPPALVLQLHQRAGGRVLGFVPGGTHYRTVLGGQVTASALTFEVELADPELVRVVTFAGTVSGSTFTGTADDGTATQAVTLTRTSDVLHERRFLFARLVEDEPVMVRQLSVLLDGGGELVAGGWVGEDDCGLWGCSGSVTSFSEVGGVLEIGLETGGGSGSGSLEVTFDPDFKLYVGTYTFTDGAVESGDLVGARTTRTRTDHAAEVLAAAGAVADTFESGGPFSAPHPAFAPGFFNNGATLMEYFAELNAEIAEYSEIEASFRRIRMIHTVEEPLTLPDLWVPISVELEMRRSGAPLGGGPVTTYFEAENVMPDDELRYLTDAGGWVFGGNQQPAFDLPFDYAIETDAGGSVIGSRLIAPTPGGDVYVSLGPFGAHFSPLTGHAYGDAKANLSGLLVADESEMVELEPDLWGYFGGVDGAAVRDRNPLYVARQDGWITSVRYNGDPSGYYFDDVPHWEVGLRLVTGAELRLGHLGVIAPDLRDAVLLLTGLDADTFAGPEGTDLMDGFEPLAVSAGAALAYPQIIAQEVPGHANYWRGGGGILEYPHAQMEWFIYGPIGGGQQADTCTYRYIRAPKRAQLQAVMDLDMADPVSARYRDRPWTARWEWAGEARLCLALSRLPEDFSSLYSSLGGWFKVGETNHQLFAWAPMATDTATYDSSLYDPANIGVLVLRRLQLGAPYTWDLPGGPFQVFYPVGEVIDDTGAAFLVKWRLRDFVGPEEVAYQWASYFLDSQGLLMRWGEFAATAGDATVPVLTPVTPPNDDDVLRYDHEHSWGY